MAVTTEPTEDEEVTVTTEATEDEEVAVTTEATKDEQVKFGHFGDGAEKSLDHEELINIEQTSIISMEEFRQIDPLTYSMIYTTGPSETETSKNQDKVIDNSIFTIESVFADVNKNVEETPIDEYEKALNATKFCSGKLTLNDA